MDSFSLHYFDDNKKNTFNNGGNNGQKMLCVNRPWTSTLGESTGPGWIYLNFVLEPLPDAQVLTLKFN